MLHSPQFWKDWADLIFLSLAEAGLQDWYAYHYQVLLVVLNRQPSLSPNCNVTRHVPIDKTSWADRLALFAPFQSDTATSRLSGVVQRLGGIIGAPAFETQNKTTSANQAIRILCQRGFDNRNCQSGFDNTTKPRQPIALQNACDRRWRSSSPMLGAFSELLRHAAIKFPTCGPRMAS